MFRAGHERHCPGLKMDCVPHIGHFNGGQDYRIANTLGAVRFTREPHERVPSEGFDLIMRRDNVQDVEVYLALYDLQDMRDWIYGQGHPYVLNLLFHAWLFPKLAYRSPAETSVEAAIFGCSGVFPVNEEQEGLTRTLKKFSQRVWVKDKIYMCMGPDCARFRVDRHRLVCSFWSLCIPLGEERAVVTKHVLVNETLTHISREVGTACAELTDASIAGVLRHLEKLLKAVQSATHRLSRFMARCEGAFEGIFLDSNDNVQPARPFHGATEPLEVWEEQLALLDRSAGDVRSASGRPAPLLSEMIRRRVWEDLGRRARGVKCVPDDQETIDMGAIAFLQRATGSEKAQAVHRVLIECIHDLECLAEGNSEMLAVDGVTA